MGVCDCREAGHAEKKKTFTRRRLADHLPAVHGVKAKPLKTQGCILGEFRAWWCQLYPACLELAAREAWHGMSCDGCPVNALHGMIWKTADRKEKVSEIASCRDSDFVLEKSCNTAA